MWWSRCGKPVSVTTSRDNPQPSAPRSSRGVAGPGTPALNLAHAKPDAHSGAGRDEDSHLVMRSMVADGTRTPPRARAPPRVGKCLPRRGETAAQTERRVHLERSRHLHPAADIVA